MYLQIYKMFSGVFSKMFAPVTEYKELVEERVQESVQEKYTYYIRLNNNFSKIELGAKFTKFEMNLGVIPLAVDEIIDDKASIDAMSGLLCRKHKAGKVKHDTLSGVNKKANVQFEAADNGIIVVKTMPGAAGSLQLYEEMESVSGILRNSKWVAPVPQVPFTGVYLSGVTNVFGLKMPRPVPVDGLDEVQTEPMNSINNDTEEYDEADGLGEEPTEPIIEIFERINQIDDEDQIETEYEEVREEPQVPETSGQDTTWSSQLANTYAEAINETGDEQVAVPKETPVKITKHLRLIMVTQFEDLSPYVYVHVSCMDTLVIRSYNCEGFSIAVNYFSDPEVKETVCVSAGVIVVSMRDTIDRLLVHEPIPRVGAISNGISKKSYHCSKFAHIFEDMETDNITTQELKAIGYSYMSSHEITL